MKSLMTLLFIFPTFILAQEVSEDFIFSVPTPKEFLDSRLTTINPDNISIHFCEEEVINLRPYWRCGEKEITISELEMMNSVDDSGARKTVFLFESKRGDTAIPFNPILNLKESLAYSNRGFRASIAIHPEANSTSSIKLSINSFDSHDKEKVGSAISAAFDISNNDDDKQGYIYTGEHSYVFISFGMNVQNLIRHRLNTQK
jgi:hypothetical protein